MNTTNLFLKISIILIIAALAISSYFLFQFLYRENDPLLQNQVLPIPTLDIDTYEKIKSKYN